MAGRLLRQERKNTRRGLPGEQVPHRGQAAEGAPGGPAAEARHLRAGPDSRKLHATTDRSVVLSVLGAEYRLQNLSSSLRSSDQEGSRKQKKWLSQFVLIMIEDRVAG